MGCFLLWVLQIKALENHLRVKTAVVPAQVHQQGHLLVLGGYPVHLICCSRLSIVSTQLAVADFCNFSGFVVHIFYFAANCKALLSVLVFLVCFSLVFCVLLMHYIMKLIIFNELVAVATAVPRLQT